MRRIKRKKLGLRGLLIGIILGDGNLSKATSKQNSRLLIGHSLAQKEYCKYKLELISTLLNINYSAKEYKIINKESNKEYNIYQGSTVVHRYLTKLRHMLYDNTGTKGINTKILNYLTPEGLAYWFMDDGGVAINRNRKCINGLFISTQNFNYSEHILIKNYFLSKFNIECKIHRHGKGKYRIFFNRTNSLKFLDIVKSFKHKDLNYKFTIDFKEYIKLTEELL